MRTITSLLAAAAIGLGGAASAGPASDLVRTAAAAPSAHLISGIYASGDEVSLDKAQYYWGGRHYCWYEGWHGPGWYYCGYGWRRGYGWGGPEGWRGWGHRGWRGDRGGWHGRGDWHGRGEWRGDRRGDHGRGDWHGDRGDRGDHGDHHPH